MAEAQSRPLWQLSATELVAGYRAGTFSPVDALQACIARSTEVNPKINALTALDAEGALQAATHSSERWRNGVPLSALDGVPITVKDNLLVRDLPTHWGSQALSGQKAMHDERPVAQLRQAGAVIFGKTNVPEFTMQGYTDNLVFGTTSNPWNPTLTPGGSSGGAVALVAAGGCPVALATDGGGSIRRPASHTHLVGFKPSRGRVPRGNGLPAIFLDFEVVGPIARNVEDVIEVMKIIGTATPATMPLERPARILYIPQFGAHPVDAEIASLTAVAAQNLSRLGHKVITTEHFDLAEAVNQRWPMLSQVGLAWLALHPQAMPDGTFDPHLFGPAMQANHCTGSALPATELFDLLFEIEKLRHALGELFQQYDFLLTPAAAALPWPASQSHPTHIAGQAVGPRGHAVFAAFANAAGLPAVAFPCGFAEGLPVGLQLVAPEGADDRLLALAGEFQRHHPWPRFPTL